uniref:Ribonuclease H protein At1g65750 family n=1 Tax=Cajanus cajan TaxID=3821 RepID=A0A151TA01_CAJCA|nr:Putative ribonuclease H protein At1g65750 family [Cajanus cajan]
MKGATSLSWRGFRNVEFLVTSAYASLSDCSIVEHDPIFGAIWIWRWVGSERVRILLWKIIVKALITNDARLSRHMTMDASCLRCGTDIESVDHVFRTCPISRVVWYLLLPTSKHYTICSYKNQVESLARIGRLLYLGLVRDYTKSASEVGLLG